MDGTEQSPPSTAPAPAVAALSCPHCGGGIELRAAGYSVEVVCRYCSSRIDVSDPQARLIAAYDEAVRVLDIPLGTRGTLGAVEWEAIGYLRRSENGAYPWEEYLLFNPYRGYRWLITDGRGWSLGETLTRTPRVAHNGPLMLDGAAYTPFFAGGRAQVDYVLGEFYWRVERGEEVETADYVRPGWMLSWERNASEQNWTLSQLLDPAEVSREFGVGPPPRSSPPMPHQPSPHGRTLRGFAKAAAVAIAAMFVLMIVFGGSRKVLEETITVASAAEQSVTLGPVTLGRARQAVSVRADAPRLDNASIEFDYALVDRKTGVAWEASDLAERYSGRDSDGDWSEGSRGATTRFAGVPGGVYDLVVNAANNRWTGAASSSVTSIFGTSDADPAATESQPVRIVVTSGGFFFSNFVLAALLILLPLLFVLARHLSFETARQGQSDFATGDDDEEDDE